MKTFFITSMLFILANLTFAQDGSFDATFDLDGQLVTDINGNSDFCNDLLIQNDDKIIAVGSSDYEDLAILRYNVNGTLDTTFADGGINRR